MKTNYMMNATDVATELGISKGHAYKVIRQLNEEFGNLAFSQWQAKFQEPFGKQNFMVIRKMCRQYKEKQDAGIQR